jgi:hypothetical protein
MHDRISVLLPKDVLEQLYYKEKLSTKVLSKRFGVSQSCIYNLFGRYGLETRALQEAMLLRRKPSTKYKRLRGRVIGMLGGHCVHCGCDDVRILEVHHKAGGGKKETRRTGVGGFWYNIAMGRRRTSDLELCCKPCHAVEEVRRVYGLDCFHVVWRKT